MVADKHGKSNFMELKNALSNGEFNRFQYYLFDVLYLNGADTTKLPLPQRKELLAELLTETAPNVLRNGSISLWQSIIALYVNEEKATTDGRVR